MTTHTVAGGPTPALMKEINAAFNSRDVDCDIYEFRGDKILNKDTYWKLVEQRERL